MGELSQPWGSPVRPCRVPCPWQGWSRLGELLLFLSCRRKDFCECHQPPRGQSLGEL